MLAPEPDTAGTPGEATGASDPPIPQGRGRKALSYLWKPTPWEQRGYDWMLEHCVAVNVLLGIVFPPYGIFLLILWATHDYDKDR